MDETNAEVDDGLSSQVNLEVKSEGEINEQDLEDINQFAVDSVENFQDTNLNDKGNLPKWQEDAASAWVHVYANKSLKDRERLAQTASLIMAKNESGDLLGYSLIILNPHSPTPANKVAGAFIGVKEDLQGQGIGTRLLERRIQSLLDMGITEYRTNVRDRAIGLYDKLNIKYTAKPMPENRYAKTLTVYLK